MKPNTRQLKYIRKLRAEIENLEQKVNRLRFAIGIVFGVMTLVCMILVQE